MQSSSAPAPFLQKRDWFTFLLVFIGSMLVYWNSLPPTVTLEDAGELVVAADYLGVPHPPGYPIWTFLAWFFQWVFHGVDYHGYPNPAWSVALMSAVFGALASAVIGMVICRSARLVFGRMQTVSSSFLPNAAGWAVGLGLGFLVCILFQAHAIRGAFLTAGIAMVIIVLGTLRAFYPVEQHPWTRAWVPPLPQLGAAFYGSLLSVVLFLIAWNRTLLPDTLPVLLRALRLLVPFLVALPLLDLLLGRVARRGNLVELLQRSGLDVLTGIGGGLLLAFSPLMWSQACIVEVYSLNAFFIAMLMLMTFWYIQNPSNRILYATAFLFALSFTNHQSILFLVFFLVAGLAAGNRAIFRDAMVLLAAAAVVYLLAKVVHYSRTPDPELGTLNPKDILFFVGCSLLAVGYLLLLVLSKGGFMRSWKHMLIMLLLGGLGLSFHLFMPFASEQNPPMNWGYARTVKGFKHAIGRGQYAKFSVPDNLKRIGKTMSHRPDLAAVEAKSEGITQAGGVVEEKEAKLAALEKERDQAIQNSHETRTFFFKQLAALFYGPDSKFSMANEFSWQFPLEAPDALAVTPPPPERNIPLALIGLLPLLLFARMAPQDRGWFHATFVAMVFLTGVFMVVQWPELDNNDLFIKRVQYVQAHSVYAVWMAYGAALLALLLYGLLPNAGVLTGAAAALALLYIVFPLHKDQADPQHLELLGSSSMKGHDFGWQFGYYQLKGANGILLDELAHHENPDCLLTDWSEDYLGQRGLSPETIASLRTLAGTAPLPKTAFRKQVLRRAEGLSTEQRRFVEQAALLGAYRQLTPEQQAASLKFLHAPLPSLDYPAEMDQNAVFFGGTDPGRFVPTYMLFSAKCRGDVFLITQNALADPTYLDTMRDMYGDQIWIPGLLDSNSAFRRYGNDLRIFDPGAYMRMMGSGGQISVSGVNEVMQINFMLARDMVDRNKFRHSFYVEESYPIPWMFDYLTPHGLILKVNPEPTPLTPEMIAQDMAFWDWYKAKLLETHLPPEQRTGIFERDLVARKTFSKLRGAIAGLYFEKGFVAESERAYLDSLELYPASPEATFRLVDMYNRTFQFEKARELVRRYATFDPNSRQIDPNLRQIDQLASLHQQLQLFEKRLLIRPDAPTKLNLVGLYANLRQDDKMEEMARQVLPDPTVSRPYLQYLADVMRSKRNAELYQLALETTARRFPEEYTPLFDLAALALSNDDYQLCFAYLYRGVQVGKVPARQALAGDARFLDLQRTDALGKVFANLVTYGTMQPPASGVRSPTPRPSPQPTARPRLMGF